MYIQAKDSDDDDEVTVSVDRDRFMDEFFEQVRSWFLVPCLDVWWNSTDVEQMCGGTETKW